MLVHLERKHPGVQLSEHFAKLYVVKFLYKAVRTVIYKAINLPPLKSL
jgi:hypothetical protein